MEETARVKMKPNQKLILWGRLNDWSTGLRSNKIQEGKMVQKDLKDQGYDKEEDFFHKQEKEMIRKLKEKQKAQEEGKTDSQAVAEKK